MLAHKSILVIIANRLDFSVTEGAHRCDIPVVVCFSTVQQLIKRSPPSLLSKTDASLSMKKTAL